MLKASLLVVLATATVLAVMPVSAQTSQRKFGITDNSFLVEEAFNQEPGIVQNIFTTHWVRDTGGTDRDVWSFAFTQEWPLATQKHQFSFVIPFDYLSVAPTQGLLRSQKGLGDILVNYRYQALTEENDTPALSPRFTLLLPSGAEEQGFGSGTLGYQFQVPLSKQQGDYYFHLNAGMTLFPRAESQALGSPRKANLWGYNLGGSIIWRASDNFNLLFETVADVMDEFEDLEKEKVSVVLFSPGFRWGKWLNKTQLVLGTGFPIGLNEEADNFGVIFYLSLEFPFK